MSDEPASADPEAPGKAGYQRPPTAARFQKGQSGNPKGRPRSRHRGAPYEAVLGQMVTIRDGAVERQVTAEEAFLLQLTKRGLEGDGPAARAAMDAIAGARTGRPDSARGVDIVTGIVIVSVSPQSVNAAMEPLRMARKLDPYRPTAHIAIEPWLVEAALARLGARRLSRDEQTCVVKTTRTPHKVKWPEWWEVLP
ncbi:MAG: DUF5681 domain-containing protein [Allgaiera sp.]|jgi:hypothetical protein|nr:DUF5681 domain-containing protein [Allgaiera sp.]